MAGTNRSDVQIRFGGQEGTPPPRRLPDPNQTTGSRVRTSQELEHGSVSEIWINKALTEQGQRRWQGVWLSRSCLIPTLSRSTCRAFPLVHDKASLRNDPGLVLIRRNSPGCLTFQEDWNGVSRSLWLTATDGTSDCTLHSYCSTTIQSNDSSVQS